MSTTLNGKGWSALGVALYYLNLRTSEGTWRRDLAKPFEGEARELSRGEADLYGLSSPGEFQEVLTKFQAFSARLLTLDPTLGPGSASARVLMLKELHAATALTVDGFVLDRETGRLQVVWGAKQLDCRQMLFGLLALGLQDAQFWALGKCEGCGKFFEKPSHRAIKYCSGVCRKRLEIARYRARKRGGAVQPRRRRPRRTTSKGIDGDATS